MISDIVFSHNVTGAAVTLVPRDISTLEALSGISGSISIACWIFLIVPQLVENYRNGSAEGLSTAFLAVWLLGDICSLVGAIWAKLLSTLIALGLYFCFADVIMLSQVIFYEHLRKRWRHKKSSLVDGDYRPDVNDGLEEENTTSNGPTDPLLARRRSSDIQRRRGSASRRASRRLSSSMRRDSLSAILEEKGDNVWRSVIVNAFWIGSVVIAGAVGWLIAWQTGAWLPTDDSDTSPGEDMPIGAEILGYLSSIFYLCARVPQIYRNYSKKSCEGLSILFFVLSLLGNGTYGASILFHSCKKDYIVKNLPWLLGSLGTMVEDCTIFVQFHIYSVSYDPNSQMDATIE